MRTQVFAATLLCLFVANPAWAVINSTQDLSDFDVTDGVCDADPGPATTCTLRAEIEQYNATGPWAGTLTVPSGNYALTQGEIEIARSLRLIGTGGVVIDAGGTSRVFNVRPTASFARFVNLAIDGGASSQGAGIFADVPLIEVVDCNFSGHRAASDGGAIWAREGIIVRGGAYRSNEAGRHGGAIAMGNDADRTEIYDAIFGGNNAGESGGAVYALQPGAGRAQVEGCDFEGNGASSDGGAFWGGSSSITGSTFLYNWAARDGGAIAAVGSGNELLDSSLQWNEAGRDGGGMFGAVRTAVVGSDVTWNIAGDDGGGLHLGTAAGLQDLRVEYNEAAGLGGGVHLRGNATLTGSHIDWNIASSGGGAALMDGAIRLDRVSVISNVTSGGNGTGGGIHITRAEVQMTRVSVFDNTARRGGGIAVDQVFGTKGQPSESLVDIENSTIAGNACGSLGGGILARGRATVRTRSTTISDNNAEQGGGVSTDFGARIEIGDTIVSRNLGSDCRGDVTSLGHSLLTQPAGCNYQQSAANGDMTGAFAYLAPYPTNLNGQPGRTTVYLTSLSPAIDRGGAPCPATDQLDRVRYGLRCDIGAREFVAEIRRRKR